MKYDCPCCGHALPDRLRISQRLGTIASPRGVARVRPRVAQLAEILLDGGETPANAARLLLDDQDAVPLLYVYITQLRAALRPLGASVVQNGGKYVIREVEL